MTKKKCAFLTMENPDEFCIYDHLAVDPLEQLGWQVENVPWSAPQFSWDEFDAVVIRSPWDYQSRPQEFLATLETIANSKATLFNSIDICRWNMDKVYLKQLETSGVKIVPTIWLDRIDPIWLEEFIETSDQESRIIVKPTVGANADDVFLLDASDSEGWCQAATCFANKPAMLQPFVRSIQSRGEISLFFFAGEFSHAIRKTPGTGDFRVQEEHGGIIESFEVSESTLHVAQKALDVIEEELLYARVDLVWLEDDQPALIELELIEPSLYFGFDSESPKRFAIALDNLFEERTLKAKVTTFPSSSFQHGENLK